MKYNMDMRKARILLVLGVWVAILPYLGFPYSWKNILFTLSGLGLIYFSYLLYNERKKEEQRDMVFDNFKENGDFDKSEGEEIFETPEER